VESAFNSEAFALPTLSTSSPLPVSRRPVAAFSDVSPRMAMVPLDRTLEIAPTPRDSVLDMVLPTLPLPLDAPLYPTTEGNAPMEAVKRTYQPSTVKRHHTHGFLVRMRSKNGRRTIARKKEKGRHKLGI
ncbi:ribosomal protein L34, putative, partial [Acanthamoeba castellanii str. Neff]